MARKLSAKTAVNPQPQYDVQAIILSRFDVLQYPETEQDTERKLGLESLITAVEKSEDASDDQGLPVFYGSVCFHCSREGDSERTGVQMAAMYSFAFSCSTDAEEQLEVVARTVASTSVWSHFANLFALTNTQMRSRMPLLPPAPGKIDQQPIDKLVEVFSIFADSDDADEVEGA